MHPSDLDRPTLEAGGRPGGPPRRTYPLEWVVVAFLALGLLLIGGPYIYLDVIEGQAPAKLHLPLAAGATGGVSPGPVSGTWTVGPGSLAGYRVEEQLLGQSHAAVGRTARVTGGAVISGTEVTGAEFTVDMASVKSDQPSRDVQFRGFIMKTYTYPHAIFRLTSPIQLGSVPDAGQPISQEASGELTLRGVTEPVTFTLNAERVQGGIDVNAEIPIKFALWHVPNPSFAVAQLGSTGTIEVLLHLIPASQ